MIEDKVLHEVFDQWGAWQMLVSHLLPVGTDPMDAEPAAMAAALDDLDHERIRRVVWLLMGHGHADSEAEGKQLLSEVWALTKVGRRPRNGAECGFSSEDFGGGS